MKEASVTNIVTSDIPIRHNGIIVKLSEKGFGFIVSHQIKFRRIYFFWSALDPYGIKFEELHKGAEVEFEASEYIDKRTKENMGMRAYKIKVIKNGDNINHE